MRVDPKIAIDLRAVTIAERVVGAAFAVPNRLELISDEDRRVVVRKYGSLEAFWRTLEKIAGQPTVFAPEKLAKKLVAEALVSVLDLRDTETTRYEHVSEVLPDAEDLDRCEGDP